MRYVLLSWLYLAKLNLYSFADEVVKCDYLMELFSLTAREDNLTPRFAKCPTKLIEVTDRGGIEASMNLSIGVDSLILVD